MTQAIEAHGLIKRYGRFTALDGLDLRVEAGEVHAFLGPNGAGKSTTIRVLLGMYAADGGSVRLLGGDPWRDAVELHRRLAYVPGDVSLWPNLSGGEAIDLMHRIHGGVNEARRAALIERFALDPSKQGRSYSKGNRQKVALIAALACEVELYIFDEPTSGLDPLMERVFQDCVAELRADGRTVLLSSHILEQVEKLADAVTIIRDGRTVQSGRLDELRHLHRMRVTATVAGGDATAPRAGTLASVQGVHDLSVAGDRVSFALDREHTPAALRALADLGASEVSFNPPSLEELFMSEYAAVAR